MAKKIFQVVLITGSLASLYFVPWVLVFAWLSPLPDTVEEQLDEAIERGFDGMIVYVDQAGKPPEFYAAGWHDRANKIPAYPQALFKIASISKLYVAVAITKLAHAGRLSLDDQLADYYPELVGRIENAEEITLRQMVQHRSGIPNFTDHPGFWSDQPEGSDGALQYALDLPANFKPGEGYAYSNTNYLLLSEIIEKIVGYNRHQFLREEILIPLGLKNTFGSLSEVDTTQLMSGYYVGIDEDMKLQNVGMIATAEDVGIFLRALNDGSLFEDGEQAIYSSIYEYEHTGLVPGYQSIAKYHEDMNTVVVQFNNTTDFNGYEWNLAEIMYGRVVKIVRRRKE
ncbi:serine hydrolase domain-containing protein [Neolewinella agarilytica]|uniref:Beta-lactamase n=1 Tax=Neolewinella agarilytica TaxID=478744 RepID=A0A1H9NS15_9BACT|nr:serine hydrolase domain-containing protein [Neolewinella agarilytica]SER38429.1 Beta-lactamase [Neolewinella agarilytica]